MAIQLEEMVEPVVTTLGYELWGLEQLSQGKYSVVKIYIEKEDGIDVEDCARVSRQVSSLLDVEEPIPGKYTLEVSSPGLDRRLFKLSQFDAFKGSRIKFTLRRAFEGRRKFEGLLTGIEDDEVVVRLTETEEVLFPFEDIERANVVPEL